MTSTYVVSRVIIIRLIGGSVNGPAFRKRSPDGLLLFVTFCLVTRKSISAQSELVPGDSNFQMLWLRLVTRAQVSLFFREGWDVSEPQGLLKEEKNRRYLGITGQKKISCVGFKLYLFRYACGEAEPSFISHHLLGRQSSAIRSRPSGWTIRSSPAASAGLGYSLAWASRRGPRKGTRNRLLEF